MRVIPRRSKGRRRDEKPAPAPPSPSSGRPAVDAAQPFHPAPKAAPDSRGAREPTTTAVLPPTAPARPAGATQPTLPARPPGAPSAAAEAAARRQRVAERRRAAVEAKRSRAARRRQQQQPLPTVRAAEQHRSALLIMVLTLGLLIAAVAVTGALIASSMRTLPVTLASPLQVYPVTQATPGPCPPGTRGIVGESGAAPMCYRLAQGIAIHKVADMRVQKSRVRPGGYDVAVTLRPVDRQAFADLTRATVGRDLAFVVRNRLITLPRVDMAILDGKIVVTGPPDRASANKLIRDLKGR